MANIHLKRGWELPERLVPPESVYFNRRNFIKSLGMATIGAAGLVYGSGAQGASVADLKTNLSQLPPLTAPRNGAYKVEGRAMTKEILAATFNNFFEFSTGKKVWPLVHTLETSPWTVEVTGLVEKPRTFDVDDLLKSMPLEERVYRLRCVEAWSIVVPWIGFPFSALLKKVKPLSSAKFVKMTTFMRPDQAPRQKPKFSFWSKEPWPYTEGLTMAEAMNELTLITMGIYGHILPKQHGAPIRLITPWKYGYKSIKSIVKIELTAEQPPTFWNTVVPHEYGFYSNVEPNVPHPRWSQARERVLGQRGRIPTLPYNGYASYVAQMYPKI